MAESIGRSLFELVYGEQVRLPVDIIVGNQSRMSDAVHFAQHIQQLVQDAKNHLKRAQDYQKRYFQQTPQAVGASSRRRSATLFEDSPSSRHSGSSELGLWDLSG